MIYLSGKSVNVDNAKKMLENCQKILLAIDYVMPMQIHEYSKEITFGSRNIDQDTIKKNWDFTVNEIGNAFNANDLKWKIENSQSIHYVDTKLFLTSDSIFHSLTDIDKHLLTKYNQQDTKLFQFAMKIAMADNLFYHFDIHE